MSEMHELINRLAFYTIFAMKVVVEACDND